MFPPRRRRPQRRPRGLGVPGRRGEAGERGGNGAFLAESPPPSDSRIPRGAAPPRPGSGLAASGGGHGGRGGAGTPRADWPEVSGPHPRPARSLEPGGRGADPPARALRPAARRAPPSPPLGFDSELGLPVKGCYTPEAKLNGS